MAGMPERVPTGVAGLDEVLNGGLPRNHVYLIKGNPGSGKTTLGMQFLLEGVRRGERALYMTLLHPERELREMAASHGWDLAGVEVVSLTGAAEAESRRAEQTLLPSGEVQLDDVTRAIRSVLDRVRPDRLVLDSIDQLHLLAGDPVLYRRRVVALLRLLDERAVTAIFMQPDENGAAFSTLAHGVVVLDTVVPPYGETRRRLRVEKVRGSSFAGGLHALRIHTGGVEVFPRLPSTGGMAAILEPAHSGIVALDAMLGGGLEFGTACLIAGQTGTGKSAIATAYARAAVSRGQHAVVVLFDERIPTFLTRSAGIGMDLAPLLAAGALTIREIKIGGVSVGEMAHHLRKSVEEKGAKVVVIDSLTGYSAAFASEPRALGQLHDMLGYLGQHGVLSLMTVSEHGLSNPDRLPEDASYIADTVVLLRRFEAGGAVRLAISVVKKRHGDHERTIRELRITSEGIVIGEALTGFQGVLSGTPRFIGRREMLMD
jgi:circadian clock protein KaiC